MTGATIPQFLPSNLTGGESHAEPFVRVNWVPYEYHFHSGTTPSSQFLHHRANRQVVCTPGHLSETQEASTTPISSYVYATKVTLEEFAISFPECFSGLAVCVQDQ